MTSRAALFAVPLIAGVAILAVDLLGHFSFEGSRGPIVLALVLLCPAVGATLPPDKSWTRAQRAARIACAVAPVGLAGSWAVMPRLGIGNISSFMSWLIRYPNFGPINYEVLAGMLCILGSAFLPWTFAAVSGLREHRRAVIALQLCMYLAVVWHLDLAHFAVAWAWAPLIDAPDAMHFVAGAISRLSATAGLLHLALSTGKVPA